MQNLGLSRFKHGLSFCEGISPQSYPWTPNCLENVRLNATHESIEMLKNSWISKNLSQKN